MTLYEYPDYLCHHGVKGMKWGVRKKYYIGKNRSVAKEHNATIKSNFRTAKLNYKAAKSSGNASKIASTKAAYKSAKSSRRKNLAGRAATELMTFTDSGRGSYYRHINEGDSQVKAGLKAFGRQYVTNMERTAVASVVASGAMIAGAAVLNSMMSSKSSGGANRLGSGNTVYPKYKVRNV